MSRIFAALAILSLLISAACHIDNGASIDFGRRPVLLVHGHGLSSAYWDKLVENLVENGYPPDYIMAVEIYPSRMSNLRAAENFIAPAVEQLLADARLAAKQAIGAGEELERVDIVAHSMGSVSSRWFAARMHPEKVGTWISIAGANHGSNALCSHDDDGALEMCPAFADSPEKSQVQFILNGPVGGRIDPTPFGVGRDAPGVDTVPADETRRIVYFTIRIEPDEWIKPERSAVLVGAGGIQVDFDRSLPIRETSHGNYLMTAPADHDLLPRNDVVIHLVTVMLRAGNARP